MDVKFWIKALREAEQELSRGGDRAHCGQRRARKSRA
jgi:hypothetical protein